MIGIKGTAKNKDIETWHSNLHLLIFNPFHEDAANYQIGIEAFKFWRHVIKVIINEASTDRQSLTQKKGFSQ